MKIPVYQVDAFTEKVFGGNPAAICPLEKWLPDELMQKIAAENNLSETAYFVKEGEKYGLRWFTPTVEVPLCGHATLASAHVLFHHLGYQNEKIVFNTKSGDLIIQKDRELIQMNFPATPIEKEKISDSMREAIGANPLELWKSENKLMAIMEDEQTVINIDPDFAKIMQFSKRDLIVTAKGKEVDFVSRFFAPNHGINEDPVTGSAHTLLIPYWAKVLKKDELLAWQISERKGVLYCKNMGERVLMSGKAKTFLEGVIVIDE